MPPPRWKAAHLDPNHKPQREDLPSTAVTKSWGKSPQERFVLDVAGTSIRRLTVAEVASIQGFPPGYFDRVAVGDRVKIGLAGNAVPPPLAAAVFDSMRFTLGGGGRVLELFAGAGGSALGATWAGFDVVGLVDLWEPACEILAAHFPPQRVLCESIDTVDLSPFVGVEVLSGGPPCQPFAKGSRRLGAEDPRDRCIALPRILADLQPRAFVFEESDELYAHRGGEYWRELAGAFARAGYYVGAVSLNAHDYGVPQRRYRSIVAGFRDCDPGVWVSAVLGLARPGSGGVVADVLDDAAAQAAGEEWGDWPHGHRRAGPRAGQYVTRAVAVAQFP